MTIVCNNSNRLNRLLTAEKLISKYIKIMNMPDDGQRAAALTQWESDLAAYQREFLSNPVASPS